MRTTIIVAVLALLGAGSASAQMPNITQYGQQVFAPGVDPVAGTPMWTNTYAASAAVCNQAPPPPPVGPVVNPTRMVFDDAANPTRVCIIALASSLLPALPNQPGYVSTLTQTDNIGQTSPRSAASNPFSRQGPPAVVTNVRILP